jgi:hypothetical protein
MKHSLLITSFAKQLIFALPILGVLLMSCRTMTSTYVPIVYPSAINTNGVTHIVIEKSSESGYSTPLCSILDLSILASITNGTGFKVVATPPTSYTQADSTVLVIRARVVSNIYTENIQRQELNLDRTVTVLDSNKRPKQVVMNDSCVEKVTRTGALTIALQFDVIDPLTNVFVTSKSFSRTATFTERAFNAMPPIIYPEVRVREFVNSMTNEFAGLLVRRQTLQRVELAYDEDIPDLSIGNRYAITGDWQSADKLYQKAIREFQTHEEVHKALYNHGIALTFLGEYDSAKKAFDTALMMVGLNYDYQWAREFCASMKNNAQLLSQKLR